MEDATLISKKELLELTGISYGQLYRWKRKGLIPDEWFIKKAAFTGQETFFPRDLVLPRIELIKEMKEDLSLDSLADVFSPNSDTMELTPQQLIERNIVSSSSAELFHTCCGKRATLRFYEGLALFVLDRLILSGSINADEGRQVLAVLMKHDEAAEPAQSDLLLFRKLGVFCCLLLSPPCKICPGEGIRIIEQINLFAAAEELKLKLL